MHKVFISFFNKDLRYKEALNVINDRYKNSLYIDGSVDTRDISDDLSDEQIRKKIRDEYLRDTSVTVILVGKYTRDRKHVDWEIGSSVIDGERNKRSGIVVIQLPINQNGSNVNFMCIGLSPEVKGEVNIVTGGNIWNTWIKKDVFKEFEYLPERLQKNIRDNDVSINILRWTDIIKNPKILFEAIEDAYKNKDNQNWNTSLQFRRKNNDSFLEDKPYILESSKSIGM